jgi:prophage regulatory protein
LITIGRKRVDPIGGQKPNSFGQSRDLPGDAQNDRHHDSQQSKGTEVNVPQNTSPVAVLRRAQLQKFLQMPRSSIYERLNKNSPRHDPLFPVPIRYGGSRCVYWLETEVKAWLDLQVSISRA